MPDIWRLVRVPVALGAAVVEFEVSTGSDVFVSSFAPASSAMVASLERERRPKTVPPIAAAPRAAAIPTKVRRLIEPELRLPVVAYLLVEYGRYDEGVA